MSSPKKPRGPEGSDDIGTRVWRRLSMPPRDSDIDIDTDEVQRLSTRDIERVEESVVSKVDDDAVGALRKLIRAVRQAPRDAEARRRLRAYAAERGVWEQLAVLLADEAHVDAPGAVMAALYEELADVHENLDQPIETISAMEAVVALQPDEVAHHDRLAWLYRRAGAWAKAAESFEHVAALATDDRSRAALRAAGKLYRDNGRLDKAAEIYRAIVARKAGDVDAWKALDELLTSLNRWRELADVRGARAELASGVEKAALLRAQARAFEQAGETGAAAEVVRLAAQYAPDDVSGLVDYVDVLAREGRGREGAEVLSGRVDEALDRGAPPEQVAALQLRLSIMYDEAGERGKGSLVLADLFAMLPEYVPALERAAERERDPKQAAALWMRMAAVDGKHRLFALTAAGKAFGEAGDHRGAVRALEEACELAPGDTALRITLEEVRTLGAIARASDDASAGDKKSAEKRLRQILNGRPHDLAANLALADVLDDDAAAAHLEEVVGELTEDVAPEVRARLVYRLARAVAATGRADEAHQLLHEAHRLSRRDLAITLALGESCFARKLWREAAIHLGALADHPDAAANATRVASGLVKAAQAEIRALRPGNAEKHYQAAVRLDAACGRAWHALAELAMEKGDTARACDCLEREAAASSDPRDRLRLYDALGDLAEGVLEDVRRAEAYWREAPPNAEVLEKLLRVQRKRGAGAERGDTCEKLAQLEPQRRKELFEEAVQAYAAGGDKVHARQIAEALVAEHPLDLDALSIATSVPTDPVRIAQWLRRALTTWDQKGAPGKRGEGDPRRAELWRRLGDAERARGDEAASLRAYQRAVATAPESDGAMSARRGLVELAASSGRDENSSRIALVEAHQDVGDVVAWARSLAQQGNVEDARAAFELAEALGAQVDDAIPASRSMASDEAYGGVLDADERRALIDDEDEGPLPEVLALAWEAAPLLYPDARAALQAAGYGDARRVSASSEAATVAMLPQIAKALAGPATLLHFTTRPIELELVVGSPPLVVIGPRLASVRARTIDEHDRTDLELRFKLGRIVELARPHRILARDPDFLEWLRAETQKTTLPLVLRKKLVEKLAQGGFDAVGYRAACERAADRAGLFACGHVGVAIDLAGGPEQARHLVKLASSQRYIAGRKKLRPRRSMQQP
ncbi:MAG: hypothetical protein JO257_08480 [Deltaproteobacteria bacterium]|nr:hypothetical protein [Deltaproteobacteria bacterium]